jgi:phosphatidylglycerophosphate synthase
MHIQQTQELSVVVVVVVSFFFLSLSLSLSLSLCRCFRARNTAHKKKHKARASQRLITAPESALLERKLVFTDEMHPDIIYEAVYF